MTAPQDPHPGQPAANVPPAPAHTTAPDAHSRPLPAASLRDVRRLEVRAALLLVFMAAMLLASVLYLMWVRGAFEETQALYLTTDDSEGVVVGMDMTFSGFPIGRVSRIELAEQGTVRIRVDVPVRAVRWLRTSSVYTLEKGLVGAARLRAFTGVLGDPPLPPGSVRPVLRGDVSAEIPRMVADARDVLQNVKRITDENSQLSEAVRQLSQFTSRMNGAQGGFISALTGNGQDARRVSELLAQATRLIQSLQGLSQRVDGVLGRADQQVLGKGGLMEGAQASVNELTALLTEARHTLQKADAVLKDAQVISGNARNASADLDALRADVEASLRKVDAMMTQLNRRWPFAPRQQEVPLP